MLIKGDPDRGSYLNFGSGGDLPLVSVRNVIGPAWMHHFTAYRVIDWSPIEYHSKSGLRFQLVLQTTKPQPNLQKLRNDGTEL